MSLKVFPHNPPPEPPFNCPPGDYTAEAAWLAATFAWRDWQKEHSHAFVDCRDDDACGKCEECSGGEHDAIHAEPFAECRHG